MSKRPSSKSPKLKLPSAKELKIRVDELTEEVEKLHQENEQVKTKFKLICKKIVDNIDLSDYAFIDPNIEPDLIDLADLFHMIQKLSLLATQVNTSEKIESHMERLESRITELANENSTYFTNKLKLHERLEFIMTERDVWKRNAETLKAMYSKLVKEHQAETLLSINKCVVGAQTANIDASKPNQRTFTANIPKRFNENLINFQTIDKKLENKINEININQQKILAASQANENYFQKNFNIEDSLKQTTNLENFATESVRSVASDSPDLSNKITKTSSSAVTTNGGELTERPMTSMMNRRVSFNKDIDVKVFMRNSKNTKLIESYLVPMTATPVPSENSTLDILALNRTGMVSIPSLNKLSSDNENDMQNQIRNLLSKRNSINIENDKVTNEINNSLNLLKNMNLNNSLDNRFTNRAAICSNRKYPGETPVKDLEPTLKMIIIKELSVEKVDGNDWRLFARKIGINDNEIGEWKKLQLQYPMARVLSFWSSRSDATTRLLHRHLNSPQFNYGSLAKRIENFYDVI